MSRRVSRREVDDIGKRNINKSSYRNRKLAGKTTTIDEYTEEKIYLNTRYTPSKRINVDHVVPIDKLINRYGEYLSVDELKKVGVIEDNLAVTNERLNKAKGAKSNLKYIIDNLGKTETNVLTVKNMLKKQCRAELGINKMFIMIMTNKIEGSLSQPNNEIESSNKPIKDLKISDEINFMLYSTALSSAQILYRSYNGELTRDEAVKEIVKETGIVIGSVAIEELLHEIGNTLESRDFADITEYINLQSIVSTINSSISIIKYINSDIDGYQCINSLIFNIIKSPLYVIAYATGGPVAKLITTFIISNIQCKISTWLIEWQSEVRLSKKQMRRYDKLIEDFNNKINSDRSVISKYIEKKNHLFDSQVLNGYYNLCFSIKNNNSKGITDGLNQILKYFNKEVIFKDLKSFDEFFFDDNQVLKL